MLSAGQSVNGFRVLTPPLMCLPIARFGHSVLHRTMVECSHLMAKKKNPAAVQLGRKGGKASAEKLTEEQRKEKARKAAQARWGKRHE